MKKIYLSGLLLFFIVCGNLQAQVNNYVFAQSNGSYTTLAAPTILGTATGSGMGNQSLDDIIYPLNFPGGFSFQFNGQAYTSCNISTNGFITFGATAPSSSNYLPIGTTNAAATYAGAISVWGEDNNAAYITSPAIAGSLRYQLLGSAPNRQLVIEWKDFRPHFGSSPEYTFNYQVRLIETTNVIQFVYGQLTYYSGSVPIIGNAQVGLRGASVSDFQTRENDDATLFSASTNGVFATSAQRHNTVTSPPGMPPAGLTYTWTPPTTDAMNYVNLQFPGTATAAYFTNVNVYAQGYEPGVTEAPGAGAGVQAWIGYSSTNTNPGTWMNWVPASFNTQVGNNDEFVAGIGAGLAPGTYYYASRWKLNSGPYRYGGFNAGGGDGFWDGVNDISGVLTVSPPPPPANDNCGTAQVMPVNPDYSCFTSYLGTTSWATASNLGSECATGANDDVWFSFTATNAAHRISLFNTTKEMTAVVYNGTCASMSYITCATTVSGSATINLTGLTVGGNYLIKVFTTSTVATDFAEYTFCVGTPLPPPANDICSGAVVIAASGAFPYLTGVTAGTYATDAGDPAPSCRTNSHRGVWYSFTPAISGSYTISSCQSDAGSSTISDNILSVYTSSNGCAGPFTSIACDDDACTSLGAQAIVTTPLTAGTTYYILASAFGANEGNVQLHITAPAPMSYVSSITTQTATDAISAGSTNQQIIGVEVVVNGAASPLSVTQFNFNTAGSTNASTDIAAARVYFTGTSPAFATGVQFGSTVNNPNGAFTVNGSQALTGAAANSTHYFWLVYDLRCSATVGNVVDAQCNSIVVGAPQFPFVTSPAGNRSISSASSGTYTTVANGAWSSAATWACGNIPTSGSNVLINHSVTVNAANANALDLEIGNAGALTVAAGGTLTIGNSTAGTPKYSLLRARGQLTISGGTLKVNGSVEIEAGAGFSQSAGDMIIDGNNNGNAASSASGSLLKIASANGSVTGGTITIVDPPATGTAKTLEINIAAQNNFLVWSSSHILKLGDGVSMDASSGGVGFLIDTYAGSSNTQGMLGSVIANGGSGFNRYVLSAGIGGGTFINGNLTVNAGSEFKQAVSGSVLILGGNLLNNGTFTSAGIFALATFSGSTLTQVGIPQSIGGTGVFRNHATSPNASLTDFQVLNNNAAGVTLNVPLSVSNSFTLTSGRINTTATNLLTIGISGSSPGSISWNFGMINGPIKKWFPASVSNVTFPVGNTTITKPCNIAFTTAPSAAGTLTVSFSSVAPNFPNAAPLNEGAIMINKVSSQGSWFVQAGDGLSGGAYTGTFAGWGTTDVSDYTKTVLLKRPSAGGNWILNGTHLDSYGSNTEPIVNRSGMSGFSEFAIGTQLSGTVPVIIEYFTGTKQAGQHRLDWKINCYNTASVNLSLERSADGRNYHTLKTLVEPSTRCQQPFTEIDTDPLPGINYYRLKTTDDGGNIAYSNVVALLNQLKGFELISLAPNPVADKATLQLTSAENTRMEITITDMYGRQVSRQLLQVSQGNNRIELNLTTLAAGAYQLTGQAAGAEKKTIRFVKR